MVAITFAYVYRHEAADFDELRWSIRSVVENCLDDYRIVLVGDAPEWYTGEVIDTHPQKGAIEDTSFKLHTLGYSREVPETFVLMHDDTIFCARFDMDMLSVPRADVQYRIDQPSYNGWSKRLTHTANVLYANGLSVVWNYATHLPYVYEQDKVRQMFRDYRIEQNGYIPEVIYGNLFHDNPQMASVILSRMNKAVPEDDIEIVRKNNPILNYASVAWGDALRRWLMKRFPFRSKYENSDAPETRVSGANAVDLMVEKMLRGEDLNGKGSCPYRGDVVEYAEGRKCGFRSPQPVYTCLKYGKATLQRTGCAGVEHFCNSCPVTLERMGF